MGQLELLNTLARPTFRRYYPKSQVIQYCLELRSKIILNIFHNLSMQSNGCIVLCSKVLVCNLTPALQTFKPNYSHFQPIVTKWDFKFQKRNYGRSPFIFTIFSTHRHVAFIHVSSSNTLRYLFLFSLEKSKKIFEQVHEG